MIGFFVFFPDPMQTYTIVSSDADTIELTNFYTREPVHLEHLPD
jgi:hypothetical protein